jgi:hypothetical protein
VSTDIALECEVFLCVTAEGYARTRMPGLQLARSVGVVLEEEIFNRVLGTFGSAGKAGLDERSDSCPLHLGASAPHVLGENLSHGLAVSGPRTRR